ncbi:MAG TPA: ThuA domain-containing protein [Verrucomicrobiota bacterium]|nr:ThuA domain-containing protein [Verrucomicrobiota bacterium]
MSKLLQIAAVVLWICAQPAFADGAATNAPLRALLVTGGCCHDYEQQKRILTEGISARANVEWTIVHEGTNREHVVSIYTNTAWAGGYDVVLHNECFGFVTNVAIVENIVRAHTNGVAAVMLHCTIHSYRNAPSDEWRELLGVRSVKHGKQHAFEVVSARPEHPVMKGFPARWSNFPDELYQILETWPGVVPLATGVSATEPEQVCVWLNTRGNARVFATTLGHRNDTMRDDVFLDLTTRGLLWACGKLDENGKPLPGYGKVVASGD